MHGADDRPLGAAAAADPDGTAPPTPTGSGHAATPVAPPASVAAPATPSTAAAASSPRSVGHSPSPGPSPGPTAGSEFVSTAAVESAHAPLTMFEQLARHLGALREPPGGGAPGTASAHASGGAHHGAATPMSRAAEPFATATTAALPTTSPFRDFLHNDKAFGALFTGEGASDAGGPYRQVGTCTHRRRPSPPHPSSLTLCTPQPSPPPPLPAPAAPALTPPVPSRASAGAR